MIDCQLQIVYGDKITRSLTIVLRNYAVELPK